VELGKGKRKYRGRLFKSAKKIGKTFPLFPNQQQVVGLQKGGFLSIHREYKSGTGFKKYDILCTRYNLKGRQITKIKLLDTWRNKGPAYYLSAAILGDGSALVTWQSRDQDASAGVFARRIGPRCRGLGDVFQVNTTTKGDQEKPNVAALDPGRFAVFWLNEIEENEGMYDIFGRIFKN
jgi:hypothetical protein